MGKKEKKKSKKSSLKKHYQDIEIIKSQYLEKGVEVELAGMVGEKLRITSVTLNLTPEEWVDLASVEGEALTACCATISRIRDLLIASLRSSGFIRVDDLFEVLKLLKEHSDVEYCDSAEDDDIIQKILKTWEVIKEDVEVSLPQVKIEQDNLKAALTVMYEASSNIIYNSMFEESKRNKDQSHLHSTLQYARIFPAIKTIYQNLVEKVNDPISCFVLVRDNQPLQYLSLGLAVFLEEEKAVELKEAFNKYNPDEICEIKKAIVSVEKGLEILD